MYKVRKGESRDISIIAQYQLLMAFETETVSLDINRVKKGVKYIIDNPSMGYYLVAETELNRVAGCMLVLFEWSDWRNGQVLWIHSLYVCKEFRKNGVFKLLYNTVKEEVNASSSKYGLRLYVDRRNLKAMEVYRNFGMDEGHYSLFEWMKE